MNLLDCKPSRKCLVDKISEMSARTVSRYHSPSFFTSKGHVGGNKKNDQEIFDFTDSRLIRPPPENISNKPLAKPQVKHISSPVIAF